VVAGTSPADIEQFAQWVRDALTHYWGGPRLTESPLLQLKVIQDSSSYKEGNPANALRTVLKDVIDMLKPDGERKFTSEWLLYNILVMKFLEGKKVREIATRWQYLKRIFTGNKGLPLKQLQGICWIWRITLGIDQAMAHFNILLL